MPEGFGHDKMAAFSLYFTVNLPCANVGLPANKIDSNPVSHQFELLII